MNRMELFFRLQEAEKYFTKDEYRTTVNLVRALYERGQFDLCETTLSKLSTKEQLLKRLVEKLKEKSVYRTLKKIQEGQVDNDLVTAKGLSSLLTHAVIEIEQGNTEYKMLIPSILEKLNDVIYTVLK